MKKDYDFLKIFQLIIYLIFSFFCIWNITVTNRYYISISEPLYTIHLVLSLMLSTLSGYIFNIPMLLKYYKKQKNLVMTLFYIFILLVLIIMGYFCYYFIFLW